MRERLAVLPVLVLVTSLLGAATAGAERAAPERTAPARDVPALRVQVLASGLDHPWEVQQLPNGHLLVTQRERRTLTLVNPATRTKRNLAFPSGKVWARGETGLLDQLSRQFERSLIAKALARTGGRRIEAASLLGMGRNTITRKIQELGIGDAES